MSKNTLLIDRSGEQLNPVTTASNVYLSTNETVQDAFNDISEGTVLDGSVTTEKLADKAVTAAKLADDVEITVQDESITTAKLADYAVTHKKLELNSVQTGNIQDASISKEKLTFNAVEKVKLEKDNYSSFLPAFSLSNGLYQAGDNGIDIWYASQDQIIFHIEYGTTFYKFGDTFYYLESNITQVTFVVKPYEVNGSTEYEFIVTEKVLGQIENGEITTAKIADKAVTSEKLSDECKESLKLTAGDNITIENNVISATQFRQPLDLKVFNQVYDSSDESTYIKPGSYYVLTEGFIDLLVDVLNVNVGALLDVFELPNDIMAQSGILTNNVGEDDFVFRKNDRDEFDVYRIVTEDMLANYYTKAEIDAKLNGTL